MTAQIRSAALARAFTFAGIHSGLSDLDRHSRDIGFVHLELEVAAAWRAEIFQTKPKTAKQANVEAAKKHHAAKAEDRARIKAERRARVIAALQDGPKKGNILYPCIGLFPSTCAAFLRDMVTDGMIKAIKGRKGHFSYEVAQ